MNVFQLHSLVSMNLKAPANLYCFPVVNKKEYIVVDVGEDIIYISSDSVVTRANNFGQIRIP
jgi:hypothetical protein